SALFLGAVRGFCVLFFFQAEDGIRDFHVTGVQTCALPISPKKFTLVAGAAEGPTTLNAFDNALLAAGIGNLNLLRVSSILPPAAELVEELDIPPGALTPTAYGAITSEEPGETIAAGVAVGMSEDTFGVIMEWSGRATAEEAEAKVRAMVEAAFAHRGMELKNVLVKSAEHTVEKAGCAFAAVALWY